MELLINGLMRRGARKQCLKDKLFGGAKVIAGSSETGARNAHFASAFFRHERIEILSRNLGGTQPRKLQFWSSRGRARLKLLSTAEVAPIIPPPRLLVPRGEIELFRMSRGTIRQKSSTSPCGSSALSGSSPASR